MKNAVDKQTYVTKQLLVGYGATSNNEDCCWSIYAIEFVLRAHPPLR